MTDSEKLTLILSKVQGIKDDMQGMKDDINDLKRRVSGIELHMENETDKKSSLWQKILSSWSIN